MMDNMLTKLFLPVAMLQCFADAFLGIPSFLEFGDCPKVLSYPYLEFNKLSGIWYTQEAVPNEYIATAECDNTHYAWNSKDQFMTLILRGLSADGEKVKEISGIHLDKIATKKNPVFLVSKEGMPDAPYLYFATNYKDYLCSFSCLEYYGFRALFVWSLSRDSVAGEDILKNCRTAMTKYNLDPSILKPIVQGESCPYWKKLHAKPGKSEKQKQLTAANLETTTKAINEVTFPPKAPVQEKLDSNNASGSTTIQSSIAAIFLLLFSCRL